MNKLTAYLLALAIVAVVAMGCSRALPPDQCVTLLGSILAIIGGYAVRKNAEESKDGNNEPR